nr:hypothetical protein [Proteus mirabilis]
MASHAHSPYLDPVSVGLTVALFSFSVEVFFASGFTCSAFGGSGLTADTEGCETSLFSLVIDCSLAVDLLIAPLSVYRLVFLHYSHLKIEHQIVLLLEK